MSLRELYQEVIVDHSKNPRNFRKLEPHTHEGQGHNPLCGDRLTVFIRVKNNIIEDVSFEGSGCAISTASASMMTESLKGKTLDEAELLFTEFHDLVTGQNLENKDEEHLGKLAVFSGVSEFPARVKCASLAWHTMKLAIEKDNTVAQTE